MGSDSSKKRGNPISHRSKSHMPQGGIMSSASSTSVFAGLLKSDESRQSCMTTNRFKFTENLEDVLSGNGS